MRAYADSYSCPRARKGYIKLVTSTVGTRRDVGYIGMGKRWDEIKKSRSKALYIQVPASRPAHQTPWEMKIIVSTFTFLPLSTSPTNRCPPFIFYYFRIQYLRRVWKAKGFMSEVLSQSPPQSLVSLGPSFERLLLNRARSTRYGESAG